MKVEIGGVFVHVDSLDQALELVRRYEERAAVSSFEKAIAPAAEEKPAAAPADSPRVGQEEPKGEEVRRRRSARAGIKIPSASKQEAMMKLYDSLEVATQKSALRLLAVKGEDGLHVSDLRRALGLPEPYKIGGFTSSITRRAPAYGLKGEDILIVDFLGAVGGKRIYRYRLTPEMTSAMRERGLATEDKPFNLAPEGD